MKEQSKKDKDRAKHTDEAVNNENIAEEKQKEEKVHQLDTKALPAIMMLMGGAIASVVTYINHYNMTEMLTIVLVSLIGFYILGAILKRVFDSFKIVIKEEETPEEGEVIEKNPDASNEEQADKDKGKA